MIDLGLALSIALSVLILMVALWIQKPLDFSAFPTILLVSTLLRLSLNIATTRRILSDGAEGVTAAGYIIGGFSNLVMSGDFVIGLIVFLILITVNFLVITKGATRIAEVGARFTLDAIPGKQMAIDADLNAGLINDKEAQRRRRELEEESSFFGSMDGASKFVRGDAVAGIIILAVNIFGGIIIGVTRHGMELSAAADVYTKLSVGDGLVSQIPALIVSLAAALLVSKGGTRGSADQAVHQPARPLPARAVRGAALLMGLLALVPGLPMFPFAVLGGLMAFTGYAIPRRRRRGGQDQGGQGEGCRAPGAGGGRDVDQGVAERPSRSSSSSASSSPASCCRRRTNSGSASPSCGASSPRNTASSCPRSRSATASCWRRRPIRSRSTGPSWRSRRRVSARCWSSPAKAADRRVPGFEMREPAFGMKAVSIAETFANELVREGFKGIDVLSVLLTHLGETIRNNLAQLLSYRDLRALLDRMEPEYKRLVEEICPAHISYSGLQAVLKLLLAERVSIRNIQIILEAIAEIVPHVRRSEQVVEHVRMRVAQQICGDLSEDGELKVLRLGPRWDLAFSQSLKRDPKTEAVEFDLDPRNGRTVQHGSLAAHPGTDGRGDQLRTAGDAGDAHLRAHDRRAHVRHACPCCPISRSRAAFRSRRSGRCRERTCGAPRQRPAVSEITPTIVLTAFVVFCRIGGCLLVIPGFSSPRIPVRARLFVAIAVSAGADAAHARAGTPGCRLGRRPSHCSG